MIPIPRGHGLGTWRPVRGGTSARLTCPQCGLDAELDHEIAADGTVSRSVECPGVIASGGNCTWHVHVRLEGWSDRGLR